MSCPESRYSADFVYGCRSLEQTLNIMKVFIRNVKEYLTKFNHSKNPKGGKPERIQGAFHIEEIAESCNNCSMIVDATNSFHKTLLLTSLTAKKIATMERLYIENVNNQVIQPLQEWIKTRGNQYFGQKKILDRLKKDMDSAYHKSQRNGQVNPKKNAALQATVKKHDDQLLLVEKTLDEFEKKDLPQHRAMTLKFLQLQREMLISTKEGVEATIAEQDNPNPRAARFASASKNPKKPEPSTPVKA